jgi:hypothetical protein
MVENPNVLTQTDMEWSPIYDKTDKTALLGYYCLLLHKNREGRLFGKKYTIVLQHKEIKHGTGIISDCEIDRYVLFEKGYSECDSDMHSKNRDFFDIYNYGYFIYAYKSLNIAKRRAFKQYKALYMSTHTFLI